MDLLGCAVPSSAHCALGGLSSFVCVLVCFLQFTQLVILQHVLRNHSLLIHSRVLSVNTD